MKRGDTVKEYENPEIEILNLKLEEIMGVSTDVDDGGDLPPIIP